MDSFTPFSLPTDNQTTAPVEQSMDEALKDITILLVEDDKILQELYYERFVRAGFNVIQAFDGMQALDKMDTNPEIQLVLLDLMLPRLSGYDVLAHIKQDAATRNIPVIIVSALADVDDQARGLQLGAAEYITKGEMLPAAVIEKVRQYMLSVPRPSEPVSHPLEQADASVQRPEAGRAG
jgi:CheY-like chemotaxis protein